MQTLYPHIDVLSSPGDGLINLITQVKEERKKGWKTNFHPEDSATGKPVHKAPSHYFAQKFVSPFSLGLKLSALDCQSLGPGSLLRTEVCLSILSFSPSPE